MSGTLPNFPLLTRSWQTIVNDQTATYASSLSANNPLFQGLNLSDGSPILALLESNAGVALLHQYLAYKVLLSTRMATASGEDLDSWGADFLFARYPASPSSGYVVFTRATAGGAAYVPLNTLMKTTDGSQSFSVIPPPTDPSNVFDPVYGYLMRNGVYQVSVYVQAVTPGSGGNVAANTIQRVASSNVPFSVTNPSAFHNGVDQATDAQYRQAFQLYISSRDNATVSAIRNAIATTSQQYTYSILENYIAFNAPQPGAVAIYVDDGTGFVSADRQVELQNNVNAVRAAGITYFVIPALAGSVQVQCQARFVNAQTALVNIPVLQAAIASYINNLAVGQNLVLSMLYRIMYDACPAVQPPLGEVFNLSITAYDVNGNQLPNNPYGDIVVNSSQVLRFIPRPATLNGVSIIRPSLVTIDDAQ